MAHFYSARNSDFDVKMLKQARHGEIGYEQNHRATDGDPMKGVVGPGTYQIDATIADVYLVARSNRDRIVGRPLLYLVIDVFSRCIMGFHVSLGNACWIEAMAALYTTVVNREELLDEYGADCDPQQFGPAGLCHTLAGDKAELTRALPSGFYNELGIDVETAPPFRPDLKGCVESSIDWTQEAIGDFTPGWVRPDHRKRGGTDYRLGAAMNLHEFIQQIIRAIIVFNNRPITGDYAFTPDMVDLVPTPINIFNWGVKKFGMLELPPKEEVFEAIMPQAKAKITSDGIVFKGLHYTCQEAVKEHWFVRARTKVTEIDISYDPRNCNRISLHTEHGKLWACLADRDFAWRNLSFHEVEELQYQRRKQEAAAKKEHRDVRMNQEAAARSAGLEAKTKKASVHDQTLSKAKQTANIRENRMDEYLETGPISSPLYEPPVDGSALNDAGDARPTSGAPSQSSRLIMRASKQRLDELRQRAMKGA